MSLYWKKLLIAIVVILGISVWLKFSGSAPEISIAPTDETVVSVNYLSEVPATGDLKLEQSEKISIAGKILAIRAPEIKKGVITVNAGAAKFADYTLTFASNRDYFFARTPIEDQGDTSSDYLSSILESNNHQKYLSIESGRIYDIFVKFDGSTTATDREIILNNSVYSFSLTEDNYYLLRNFESGKKIALGIGSSDNSLKIEQAIAISARNDSPQKLQRENNTNNIVSRNGNHLDVILDSNNFTVLSSNVVVGFKPKNNKSLMPLAINGFDFSFSPGSGTIFNSVDATKHIAITASSGNYELYDPHREKTLTSYIVLTLIVITILVYINFSGEINKLLKPVCKNVLVLYKHLKDEAGHRGWEFGIAGGVMLMLTITSLSARWSGALTSTSLFVIAFILLLAIFRLSLTILIPLNVIFVLMADITNQFGFANLTEKISKLSFLLIFLIAVDIIAIFFWGKKGSK